MILRSLAVLLLALCLVTAVRAAEPPAPDDEMGRWIYCLETVQPPDEWPGFPPYSKGDWDRRKDETWVNYRKDAQKNLAAAGTRAVKPLLDLVGRSTDGSVRILALTALNQMDKSADRSAALPALLGLLQDRNPGTRYAAVKVLGQLAHKPAAAALQKMTADEEPVVRMVLADALGQIGEFTSVPAMLALLADENKTVRLHAIDACGDFGAAIEIVPKLIEKLRQEDINEQNAAVGAVKDLLGWDFMADGRWIIAHREEQKKPIIDEFDAWWLKTLKDQKFPIVGEPELSLRTNMVLQGWQKTPIRLKALDVILKLKNDKAVDNLTVALMDRDLALRAAVAKTVSALSGITIEYLKTSTEAEWLDRVERFRRLWADEKRKTGRP